VPVRARFRVVFLSAIVFLLVFSVPSCATPRTEEGRVTRVADGDTLTLVTRTGTKLKVRLYGIDAPEIRHEMLPGQPYGKEAKAALTALVLGRRVTVEIVDIDTHRRMVGIVRRSGSDINLAMVRSGYAWAYRRYLSAPYASEYIAAEKEARGNSLGLWKQANPDPPWEFKRRKWR
jgi:micrococcal nuclease